LDWCRINPLYVFGSASTASVHFHNKFDGFHSLCPWWRCEQSAFHF
jgi:hypothetical protein